MEEYRVQLISERRFVSTTVAWIVRGRVDLVKYEGDVLVDFIPIHVSVCNPTTVCPACTVKGLDAMRLAFETGRRLNHSISGKRVHGA